MARGFKRKTTASDKTKTEKSGDEPATKQYKPVKVTGGAFKAPEAAEVLEIAQTRNLYKSNLFRLQLEQLLKDLTVPQTRPRLEAFLRALQPALLGLKARELPADLAAAFPHLHFHQRQPFPFAFKAPQRVDVVGSFLLGTTCKASRLNVDLALEIPSEAFQSKDYLNFRYLDKRAAYVGEVYQQLLGLAAKIAEESPLKDMVLHFEALQGDAFRPCIVVRPSGKSEAREGSWVVRLLPACAPDLWVNSRLASDRNAVRPVAGDAPEAATVIPSTAHYNSCVLEDCRMRAHLEFLHNSLQRVPSLKDAILLLKRWGSMKGFMPEVSSMSVFIPLNGFCLSILAAHAALTGSVSPTQTSSFQLFKLALNILASTDWATQKVVLGTTGSAVLSAGERSAAGAHFYDSDGIFNFFWRLGPFILDLQQQALKDLKVLDVQSDPYEAVFGKCSSPELTWDVIVRTPRLGVDALCPDVGSKFIDALGKECAADVPECSAMGQKLAAAIAVGLGDRCVRTAVRLVGDPSVKWQSKRPEQGPSALVGFSLDAIQLDRLIDRGPAVQDLETISPFKKFWGKDKAEIRRFKDGSILECVVWSKPPADHVIESRKHPAVVTQIVKHVLATHFPEIAGNADIVAGPLGFVPNLADSSRRLWLAFEEFRSCLTQLRSLPLTVKDVHPSGVGFTYAEVSSLQPPPAADGVQRTLQNVVIEFESSGRWPDDPDAQRRVCTALLLQMKEELKGELGIESDVTEGFLDVRFPEFVFRVQVFHQHELSETAHRVTNFQVQAGSPLPDSMLVDRLRNLWWRPRIVANLHAQVVQKPAMAGALRLCKRWMASQMLSGYDEFTEHLVASVFLQPWPFEEPTSPQVGFCRVLWLLDTYDWSHEPLIVDFDGKLSEENRLAIRQSFENTHDGAGVSFWISSRFDPHAMLLTIPPATVNAWLQKRARRALAVYGRRLLGIGTSNVTASLGTDWQQLFAMDLSIFDVIIRLMSPESNTPKAKKGTLTARRHAVAMREAVAGLTDKLRKHLSSVCMVFDDVDSRIIGLKWRPDAFFPQQQNILMGSVPHTMLPRGVEKPPLCVPNILCLTSLISSLADGLVVDIKLVGADL